MEGWQIWQVELKPPLNRSASTSPSSHAATDPRTYDLMYRKIEEMIGELWDKPPVFLSGGQEDCIMTLPHRRIPELSVVRALVSVGKVPAQSIGTVVHVYQDGAAYEVEFTLGDSAETHWHAVEMFERTGLEVVNADGS